MDTPVWTINGQSVPNDDDDDDDEQREERDDDVDVVEYDDDDVEEDDDESLDSTLRLRLSKQKFNFENKIKINLKNNSLPLNETCSVGVEIDNVKSAKRSKHS